jgi:hypothetical protein
MDRVVIFGDGFWFHQFIVVGGPHGERAVEGDFLAGV